MKEVRDRIASVKNTSKITEVSRRGGQREQVQACGSLRSEHGQGRPT